MIISGNVNAFPIQTIWNLITAVFYDAIDIGVDKISNDRFKVSIL